LWPLCRSRAATQKLILHRIELSSLQLFGFKRTQQDKFRIRPWANWSVYFSRQMTAGGLFISSPPAFQYPFRPRTQNGNVLLSFDASPYNCRHFEKPTPSLPNQDNSSPHSIHGNDRLEQNRLWNKWLGRIVLPIFRHIGINQPVDFIPAYYGIVMGGLEFEFLVFPMDGRRRLPLAA